MKRFFALALFAWGLVAAAQYAPQSAGTAPLAPELESEVQRIGKELRCAVCQGMSISDSPSNMARAQLDVVRTMVKEGKTEAEIKQYFVERYGEWALLEPTKSGANLLVWGGPFVLVLGGILFVFWYALRQRAGGKAAGKVGADAAAAAPPKPAEDPYLSAVRAELDR